MESCKEIGNRVKELRNQAELSQQDLADALRVKRETVKFWEAGERYFKAADIIALAQFFNVSADYILGLSVNPTTDHDLDFVCNYTGLSIPAIEALRLAPVRIPEEYYKQVSNLFFCAFWDAFALDLAEMVNCISGADEFMEDLNDPDNVFSIAHVCERLKYWEKELQLSAFRFSERCRYITDRLDCSFTLQKLQKMLCEMEDRINNGNS